MDTKYSDGSTNSESDFLTEMAPEYLLFSLNHLAIAAFFGGPIAGFYMIYYNLNKLVLRKRIGLAAAIIFGVVFLSFLPDLMGYDDILSGFMYSVFYAVGTYYTGRYVMEDQVKDHEFNGGNFWGIGRVVVVIIVNIILILALMAIGLMVSDFDGFKRFMYG